MGGTYIPFPNVPEYPGVPPLMRAANAAIASNPALSIGIGTVENLLIQALQQAPRWGIFDRNNNQLGIPAGSQSILTAIGGTLLSQLTGSLPPVLSVLEFDFVRETRISDFPVILPKVGSFASYNKVQLPANPVVTLILEGQESDRTALLEAIDAACISADLYSVITPEIVYQNYALERYSYARRAEKGLTLLYVEVSLKEIRTVSAQQTQVTSTLIVDPQDVAATPEVNNGVTQGSTPSAPVQSWLLGISKGLGSLFQ